MGAVGRWQVWGRVCALRCTQLWVLPPGKQGRGRQAWHRQGREWGPGAWLLPQVTGTKWGSSQQDEMGRGVMATCSEQIVFGAQFEQTGY